MKHLKNILIAIIVGFVLTGVTDQFSSSKIPPCDLVVKGTGVSTYGCTYDTSPTYPCSNEIPNTESMTNCVQQNYYRSKTFPFGFKQHFGPDSNLVDHKPLNQNRIATFTLGFMLTIVLLYAFRSVRIRSAQSTKNLEKHRIRHK